MTSLLQNRFEDSCGERTLSVVISVFNEEENIPLLMKELFSVEVGGFSYEYIFVDDGSTDSSEEEISKICYKNKNVKMISFSRNFGHEVAMVAGMHECLGDAVIFMDADLQHPPSLIPEMIKEWKNGALLVLTNRVRNESAGLIYRFTIKFYYKLLNRLTGFSQTENSPDFRLLDRCYINELKKFSEHSVMFRGLINWLGGEKEIVRLDFVAPKRENGESKYRISDLLKLGVDAIFAFSLKPMKLALIFSGIGIIFSTILGLYLVIPYLLYGIDTPGFLTVIFAILCTSSIQLIIFAVFAEYLGRIHIETKKRPSYILKKRINFSE